MLTKFLEKLDCLFNGEIISNEQKKKLADQQKLAFETAIDTKNNYSFDSMEKIVGNINWLQQLDARSRLNIIRDKSSIENLWRYHKIYQKNQIELIAALTDFGYQIEASERIAVLYPEIIQLAKKYNNERLVSAVRKNNDLLCDLIQDERVTLIYTFYEAIRVNTREFATKN